MLLAWQPNMYSLTRKCACICSGGITFFATFAIASGTGGYTIIVLTIPIQCPPPVPNRHSMDPRLVGISLAILRGVLMFKTNVSPTRLLRELL